MNTLPTFVLPLPHLALIEARGADVETFLQGQLSNDVRRLTAARAQLSSLNSPKGRMLAVLHLLRDEHAIYLEVHRELLDATLARLRLFVLRSKVTLTPADRSVFGIAGPDAAALVAHFGVVAPGAPLECAWHGDLAIVRRLGEAPRFTLTVPSARAAEVAAQLEARAAAGDAATWKRLELEAGIPTIYPATRDRFVPQMCNLDALGGISFDKGCYTGQEVVARVHYRGAVKRHSRLEHLPGPPPAPGTKLDSGEVVDAVALPDGGALAMVVAAPA